MFVITYTIDLYDGIDHEAKGLIGAFELDLEHALEKAVEWWRANAERFDCVSRVTAEFSPINADGFAAPFELMATNVIYTEGRK